MKCRILNNQGPCYGKYRKIADIGFSAGIVDTSGKYFLVKFPDSMYPGVVAHNGGRFSAQEYWWVRPENIIPLNDEPFTDKDYEEIFV